MAATPAQAHGHCPATAAWSPPAQARVAPFLWLQRWRAVAPTASPSRVPLCAPALHPSPSSLLLRSSPSSQPWWLTFHHLLAPAHLPPDTQMLSPKLGVDHARALKLSGTEDLLETGKLCTLSAGKRTHLTTGVQQAGGLGEPVTLAWGSPQGSRTPQYRGCRHRTLTRPPASDRPALRCSPCRLPRPLSLNPSGSRAAEHHCLPGCHPPDTRAA